MKRDNLLHLLILFNKLINVSLFGFVADDKSPITSSQLLCLRYLYLHPKITASGLAKGLNISCGATSRLVDRLEQKGFVIRDTPSDDRRVHELLLSLKGRALLEKAASRLEKNFRSLLANFTQEEQAAMEKFFRAFLQKCINDPQIATEVCLGCGILHNPDCPGNLGELSETQLER
jgi:DNA-binding MarR family transcriptional regulator